jgi:hypothetical protein
MCSCCSRSMVMYLGENPQELHFTTQARSADAPVKGLTDENFCGGHNRSMVMHLGENPARITIHNTRQDLRTHP